MSEPKRKTIWICPLCRETEPSGPSARWIDEHGLNHVRRVYADSVVRGTDGLVTECEYVP